MVPDVREDEAARALERAMGDSTDQLAAAAAAAEQPGTTPLEPHHSHFIVVDGGQTVH